MSGKIHLDIPLVTKHKSCQTNTSLDLKPLTGPFALRMDVSFSRQPTVLNGVIEGPKAFAVDKGGRVRDGRSIRARILNTGIRFPYRGHEKAARRLAQCLLVRLVFSA